MTYGADDRRQITVAFWRRSAQGIEFYIPFNSGYPQAMTHCTNDHPADAARSWVEQKFGFNPRSEARVFDAAAIGCMVAFSLTATELDAMSRRMIGAWLSAWDAAFPASQMLGYVQRHLA